MEYEIADDPQGERERFECRRDGGLEEDLALLRTRSAGEGDQLLVKDSHQQQG